jgi:hypothetical protein
MVVVPVLASPATSDVWARLVVTSSCLKSLFPLDYHHAPNLSVFNQHEWLFLHSCPFGTPVQLRRGAALSRYLTQNGLAKAKDVLCQQAICLE